MLSSFSSKPLAFLNHLPRRRIHPRTAADFEILYNELEAWRLQETRKIKEAGLSLENEQEVMQQLLHKETKLLQVSRS